MKNPDENERLVSLADLARLTGAPDLSQQKTDPEWLYAVARMAHKQFMRDHGETPLRRWVTSITEATSKKKHLPSDRPRFESDLIEELARLLVVLEELAPRMPGGIAIAVELLHMLERQVPAKTLTAAMRTREAAGKALSHELTRAWEKSK